MLPNTSNSQGQPGPESGQIESNSMPPWAKAQHDLLLAGMREYHANPQPADAIQAQIDANVHRLEGEAPQGEPDGEEPETNPETTGQAD